MAGIVLAGGEAARLGFEKTTLEVAGRRTLDHVLSVLGAHFSGLIVVAPRPLALPAGVRWVPDRRPGTGPLGALQTGLEEAEEDLSFVAACDLPFLSAEFVGLLLELAPGFDVVVPEARDGLHPLCAAYRRSCLPAIEQALCGPRADKGRVRSFYSLVRVRGVGESELRAVDPELVSLVNINTPADLRRAEEMARVRGGRGS
jgi:molybdopterin-guanine dinucleotide biosynthesis protein A